MTRQLRVIILGAAGSGKSTLCCVLRNWLRALFPRATLEVHDEAEPPDATGFERQKLAIMQTDGCELQLQLETKRCLPGLKPMILSDMTEENNPTTANAWNDELWQQTRGEMLGFALALERNHSGLTAEQLRVTVKRAEAADALRRLLIEIITYNLVGEAEKRAASELAKIMGVA